MLTSFSNFFTTIPYSESVILTLEALEVDQTDESGQRTDWDEG